MVRDSSSGGSTVLRRRQHRSELRLGVLHSALDDYGSEARVMVQLGETPAFLAEMYKAVIRRCRSTSGPRCSPNEGTVEFDSSGHVIDTYQVDQFGGELDVLRELSRFAAVGVGVRRFSGDAQRARSATQPARLQLQRRGIYRRRVRRSPRRSLLSGTGTLASVQYVKSSTKLGADEPYEQVQSQLITARASVAIR